MLKIWSELPTARLKEQLADVLTAGWVVVWGGLAWQLYGFLASFAVAGRTIRSGGEGIVQAGRDLGEVLGQIPLIGEGARDIARNAFAGGSPCSTRTACSSPAPATSSSQAAATSAAKATRPWPFATTRSRSSRAEPSWGQVTRSTPRDSGSRQRSVSKPCGG